MRTDYRPEVHYLLDNLRTSLPSLLKTHEDVSKLGIYEDGLYRFYHHSFKVYQLQSWTSQIAADLRAIHSERPLNPDFLEIVDAGTGIEFTPGHNDNWSKNTRPIVEAFLHAKYFLEMTIRCAQELTKPPLPMPSHWAAVLYLYGMR